MSFTNFMNPSLSGFCVNVARQISDTIVQNNPTELGYHVGTLDMLASPSFMNSNLIDVDPRQTGVARRQEVFFRPRPLASDGVTSFDGRDCDGTEVTTYSYTCIVDNAAGSQQESITHETLQQLCEGQGGPQQFIETRMMPLLWQARKTLNDEVLTELNANCIGVNINNLVSAVPSASAKSVDFLDADCNPIAKGLATVAEDYEDHMLGGTMGAVGQGNLTLWARLQGIACCNDGGVNINAAGTDFADWRLYKDRSANSILGDNNFIVAAPGSVKLLTFTENRGRYMKISDTFVWMEIPDPVHPDLSWDFEMHLEPCGKKWTYFVNIHWNLCCWPSDIFQTGDELENVTGVFLYTANQLS